MAHITTDLIFDLVKSIDVFDFNVSNILSLLFVVSLDVISVKLSNISLQ